MVNYNTEKTMCDNTSTTKDRVWTDEEFIDYMWEALGLGLDEKQTLESVQLDTPVLKTDT